MHFCQVQLVVLLVQLHLVVANHPLQSFVDELLLRLPGAIVRSITFPLHLIRNNTAEFLDLTRFRFPSLMWYNHRRLMRASRGMLPGTHATADDGARFFRLLLLDGVVRLHSLRRRAVLFDRHEYRLVLLLLLDQPNSPVLLYPMSQPRFGSFAL